MRLNALGKFLLLLFLVSLLLAFLPFGKDVNVVSFKQYLSRLPSGVSESIFILLYLVLPKDVLRITGAVIYGAYLSSVLVMIGEVFSLIIFFQLSRKFGRAFVEKRLKEKMAQVDAVVVDTSWGAIFMLRFFPVIAFRVLDLGFGLTKISFGRYFAISLLASPVRIFLIQLMWSLGPGTVMNPERMSEYFNAHPLIAVVLMAYVFGTIVMFFVLGKAMIGRKGIPLQKKV